MKILTPLVCTLLLPLAVMAKPPTNSSAGGLTAANEAITDLQSEVDDLKVTIGQVQQSLSTLQENVKKIDKSVAGLSSKLSSESATRQKQYEEIVALIDSLHGDSDPMSVSLPPYHEIDLETGDITELDKIFLPPPDLHNAKGRLYAENHVLMWETVHDYENLDYKLAVKVMETSPSVGWIDVNTKITVIVQTDKGLFKLGHINLTCESLCKVEPISFIYEELVQGIIEQEVLTPEQK